MIKIAISEAAFEAIAQTARVRGRRARGQRAGERIIGLNRTVADRLGAMRGPGESFSDVILRIAAEG